MAVNKRSADYIPTYADLEYEHDMRKAYMEAHKQPIRKFSVTYSINGVQYAETCNAASVADVEATIKHNCSVVGWYPVNLVVREVED